MTIRTKAATKEFRAGYDQIVWGTGKEDDHLCTSGTETTRTTMVIHDIQPFKAPDGTVIKSRKHRDSYMKERGLANAGDFTEHWKAKAKERELRSKGRHPDQIRELKRTISDAYEHARDKSRYSKY